MTGNSGILKESSSFKGAKSEDLQPRANVRDSRRHLSAPPARLATLKEALSSSKLGEGLISRGQHNNNHVWEPISLTTIHKQQVDLAERVQQMHEKQLACIAEVEQRIISAVAAADRSASSLRVLGKVGPYITPRPPAVVMSLPRRLEMQNEGGEETRTIGHPQQKTSLLRMNDICEKEGVESCQRRRSVQAIEEQLNQEAKDHLDVTAVLQTGDSLNWGDEPSSQEIGGMFGFVTQYITKIRSEDDKKSNAFMTAGATSEEPTNICMKIVGDKRFEGLISSLIVANSVTIGMQTDWNAQQAMEGTAEKENSLFRYLELFFIAAFAMEAVIRAFSQGILYVVGREWRWNMFDVFVIVVALVEELLSHLDSGTSITNIRVLRILRLVRIIRVVRITRFFRELRVMVCGIQSSMQSLIWAMVLLLLVMFMFAVLIMQSITDALVTLGDSDDELRVKEMYGTMTATLYTLFLGVTSGSNWGDLAWPLIKVVSPFFSIIWCVYIALVLWALMNVITGVFVDGAIKMAEQDAEHVVKEETEARKMHTKIMKRLFQEADSDGNGLVTWEEFSSLLGHPNVRAYFRSIGLDIAEARSFFNLLDFDGSGEINRDEFVVGFTQLRGSAKSLDIARMRHEHLKANNSIRAQVLHLTEVVDEWFGVMANQLGLGI